MRKDDISRYLKIIRRTGAPIILANGDDEPVILLPLEDYELLLESDSNNVTVEEDEGREIENVGSEVNVSISTEQDMEADKLRVKSERDELAVSRNTDSAKEVRDDVAHSMYGDFTVPKQMMSQNKVMNPMTSDEISQIPLKGVSADLEEKKSRDYMNKQFVPSRRDLREVDEDIGTDDVIERQVKKHLKFAEEQFYLEPLDE